MTPETGRCLFASRHDEIINVVKSSLPSDEVIYKTADLLKAFSDMTRLKILCSLLESEMCVCAISQLLCVSQSAVSHQLRTLKNMNLVTFRKVGKTVYYSPADDHIRTIIEQGIEHVTE